MGLEPIFKCQRCLHCWYLVWIEQPMKSFQVLTPAWTLTLSLVLGVNRYWLLELFLPFSYDLDDPGQRVTASHLRYVCIHSSPVLVHSNKSLFGNKSPCPSKESLHESRVFKCTRMSVFSPSVPVQEKTSVSKFCFVIINVSVHKISTEIQQLSFSHLIQNCQIRQSQEFYSSRKKLPSVGLYLMITGSRIQCLSN